MTTPEPHAEPEPEAGSYPTFDDDPARWGLKFPPPMTAAEVEAAEQLEAWGPEGPPASYAEWLAESQQELEAELRHTSARARGVRPRWTPPC